MQMRVPFIDRKSPSLQMCSSANCFRQGQESCKHGHISEPVRGTKKGGTPYKRTPQEEDKYMEEKQARLHKLQNNNKAPQKPFETHTASEPHLCVDGQDPLCVGTPPPRLLCT